MRDGVDFANSLQMCQSPGSLLVQGSCIEHLIKLHTLDLDFVDSDFYEQLDCWLDDLPATVQHVSVSGGVRDVRIFSWPGPPTTRIQLSTEHWVTLDDAAGRLAGCSLELRAWRSSLAIPSTWRQGESAINGVFQWIVASEAASVTFHSASASDQEYASEPWATYIEQACVITMRHEWRSDDGPLCFRQHPRCKTHKLSCCVVGDRNSLCIRLVPAVREP